MTVRAILDAKGRQVVSIGADAKVSSAVKILSERRIGAVLVFQDVSDTVSSGSLLLAIPIALRCGRLTVLMLDDRGDRDLWREKDRALGTEQWALVEHCDLGDIVGVARARFRTDASRHTLPARRLQGHPPRQTRTRSVHYAPTA